ncbi:MAG TPA: hypothetical protein VF062_22450, partial [Candidatus Limnocylindrales bacterium]
MARRVRPVVLAASLALLAGCSVGGQPSVGAALPATTSSSATPTTTPAAPAGGRPTVTVTQATTLSPSTQGSLQVAPADFTAFSDLNWAARWNDSTTDPNAVSDCEQLED